MFSACAWWRQRMGVAAAESGGHDVSRKQRDLRLDANYRVGVKSSGALCAWFSASPNRVLLRFAVAESAPFPS